MGLHNFSKNYLAKAVIPPLSRQAVYGIRLREIGSKEEVSAVHFVLGTCRELIDSDLFLWPLHNTLVQSYSSTLLISYPSL